MPLTATPGAANDTYCWLKHGVYEQCDDALFTNIGLEVEKNKTDNDTLTAPANILPKVVILNILLGVTFPNVVVVSLIVTRVIGLFGFR
jgi:hypothetical protein